MSTQCKHDLSERLKRNKNKNPLIFFAWAHDFRSPTKESRKWKWLSHIDFLAVQWGAICPRWQYWSQIKSLTGSSEPNFFLGKLKQSCLSSSISIAIWQWWLPNVARTTRINWKSAQKLVSHTVQECCIYPKLLWMLCSWFVQKLVFNYFWKPFFKFRPYLARLSGTTQPGLRYKANTRTSTAWGIKAIL